MFEVIIQPEDLKRNFNYYYSSCIGFLVCPKDRNFPYIKNGKVIQIIDARYYELFTIKVKEFNEKTMKVSSFFPINNIGLIFEFETEEEAFYFKMKYC